MEGTISRNDAYNTLTEYYHHTTEIQHKALREALERVPDVQPCEDTISRKAAIDSICRTVCDNPEICESPCDEIKVLEIMPSAQPDKDMIHLQKEQAYMQGWEEGREALRDEIWENERDRLD